MNASMVAQLSLVPVFAIAPRRKSLTWRPPCVTCHAPIGYTAKEGWYVGRVECAKCRP